MSIDYSKFETARDLALGALYDHLCNELISPRFGTRMSNYEKGLKYVGLYASGKMYCANGKYINKVDGDDKDNILTTESDIKHKLKLINSVILETIAKAEKLFKPVIIDQMKRYPGQVAYDLSDKHKLLLPQDRLDIDLSKLDLNSHLKYDVDKGFMFSKETLSKLRLL